MKLRNKKTREIGWLETYYGESDEKMIAVLDKKSEYHPYNSLAELNEEWEDMPEEEPKEHWIINSISGIETTDRDENDEPGRAMIEIGNYFETKEQAEKAVEKLKIYNKLKQKGFVFSGWYYSTEGQLVILADNHEFSETEPEDLTKLFGDKVC